MLLEVAVVEGCWMLLGVVVGSLLEVVGGSWCWRLLVLEVVGWFVVIVGEV